MKNENRLRQTVPFQLDNCEHLHDPDAELHVRPSDESHCLV